MQLQQLELVTLAACCGLCACIRTAHAYANAPCRSRDTSSTPGGVQLESGDFRITELPLRKWTQDYKEFLDGLVKPEDKAATPLLLDYKCAT